MKDISISLMLFYCLTLVYCEFRHDGPSECNSEKIKASSPDVHCLEVDSADKCKQECNILGEKKCQGQKGHVKKWICNKQDSSILCCCESKCESYNTTLERLNKALEDADIVQESYMCVTAQKSEIKEKLKEACRREMRVQIARKYCLEEHSGKYYCLKDGKCFGQLCRGCVKHECEVNGYKTILNPPEEYTQKVIAAGFQANDSISETINVQDRPGLKHEKKWCTEVPNKGQLTFKEECLKICTDFGQQICLSPPEKIAPTSDCLEHAQTCSCCCQPSCDESLRPNCEQISTPKPPSTSTCHPNHNNTCDDGIARNYDDEIYDTVESGLIEPSSDNQPDQPVHPDQEVQPDQPYSVNQPDQPDQEVQSVQPDEPYSVNQPDKTVQPVQQALDVQPDLPVHPGSRSGNLVNSPNSDPGTTTDFYDSEQFNYPEEAYDYEEDDEDEDYYEQSESRTKFRQQS